MHDDRRHDRPALALCVAYAVMTFAWYFVWKHSMAERGADEGIFENLFWNVWNGHGLQSALEGSRPHLAVHFSPLILLLLPLYKLAPSMHAIHLVVSIATAGAGYVLFRFARQTLDRVTALALMGAFLLNPTIVLQTFMDFHEQALAPLLLVLMVVAHRRGSVPATLLWGALLLSAREDNVLLLAALAVHSWLVGRNGRMASALAGLALGWIALYRATLEMLAGGALPGVFEGTYAIWGSTPAEIIRAIVTDPLRVLRHLASGPPVRYLGQLLAPLLGVTPLGDPIVLIMVPQLLLILLASPTSRMFEIRTHYSLVPVTVLYLGAIGTLGWMAGRRGRWPTAARWVACGMLLVSVAAVPIWLERAVSRLNPFAAEIREIIASVPDTASVTAPGFILNQMARRPRLAFAWHEDRLTTTDYVILEGPEKRFFEGSSVDVVYSARADSFVNAAGYARVPAPPGWHVWRRGSVSPTSGSP